MAAHSAELFGLSLCSGAGGLDLGITIACPGYRTVAYVEREAYAAAALVARMEDQALDQAPVWDDVTTFDGKPWRGVVDIISAGYPCQPFSVAGKRRGRNDPRHLWPHIARIIGEVEPSFVFLENVGNHLRLGFPEVAEGLVGMGYRVAAGLFTAAEVGAPHKRERLFILAARQGDKLADPARQPRRELANETDTITESWPTWDEPCYYGDNVDDADGAGLQGRLFDVRKHTSERATWPPSPSDTSGWELYLRHAPDLEPSVCRGTNGLAYRVDRLRLCGNGVVPLVAAYALRTLGAHV